MLPERGQPSLFIALAGPGRRSLQNRWDLGYTDVYSMRGFTGVEKQWIAVCHPGKSGQDQMARYSRHLRIPEGLVKRGN